MTEPTPLTTTIKNPRMRFLNGLKDGSHPIMTFMGLPSARTAQIVASTGVDAIIIDCEHGHIGDDQMHNAVIAIASLGVSPLIRIRGPNPDIIKRALDTGAHGIMVPQINNAKEAAQVVQYAKFPPYGLRGQGSPFPGFAHGLTVPEYMKSANQTILTILQIETEEGLANVEEIAAVPGVDMLFIGPNDLAQSILGYVPAKGDEPKFVKAIESIVTAAKKNKIWCSRLSNTGALSKEHLKVFDSIALSADMKAMMNWYQQELAVIKQ